MGEKKLAQIRARCEAANGLLLDLDLEEQISAGDYMVLSNSNDDIPELLDEIEMLGKKNKALEAANKASYGDGFNDCKEASNALIAQLRVENAGLKDLAVRGEGYHEKYRACLTKLDAQDTEIERLTTKVSILEDIKTGRAAWIPVSEGLPEEGDTVLMWHKDGFVMLAVNMFDEMAEVTHWRKLPEPPEGVEKNG